jgi:flavin reductase (DIM6/NTAB) family NADH-FMN oxidoreductase RutF
MKSQTIDDSRDYRRALGSFATGISVVTTHQKHGTAGNGDGSVGVTVNSFSSVSLDPPLIVFSLDRVGRRLANFIDNGHFCVNVLAADQVNLSDRFASNEGDFTCEDLGYTLGETGSPVLPGVMAIFECTLETTYDGGDHLMILGRVQRYAYDPDKGPLLYFRGGYNELAAPSL